MRNIDEPNKNLRYDRIIFLIFLIRTAVLGLALLKGPYFTIEEAEVESFKIFSVFLDVVNIFQFIFMFNVIERKNLFQFLLYIPLLIYAMTLVLVLIVHSYVIPDHDKSKGLYIAIAFLYVYAGVLVSEIIIHIVMYNRLKSDFKWSNFKKVGANPVINEAFKRREQFNAVKRFSIMYLCSEFLNFSINLKGINHIHYAVALLSLVFTFLVINILPEEENVVQRVCLLVFVGLFMVTGITYCITDIVLYFVGLDHKGSLVLESVFYAFTMSMLFISAYRDYRMFGSGLREHYPCSRKNVTRGKISLAR